MREREKLEQAIAHLETQRPVLGDAVVDASIAAIRQQLAALAPESAGQQRKQVTVLFADISGFTAMSEAMDAEEVSDTMNALWQRIDAVIVEHGGIIDKHIGDAVMALWGVGQAGEDDSERTIHAALAMQAELAAFRETHDVQLAMRIGINTGPVLLGGVGTTGEFSAIGDTVNLASRLEHAAPISGVLISHDTYRHVRGVFDVLPQEPITVKGKATPVRTYIVQQAKPRAFRMATRGVEGIETRMVGRDAQLLTLQNTFRDVMEDAETRVVTIVGEAGVGKSRLLYEFSNWIELLPDQIWHFKGRATPQMQRIPYSLIRDLFAFRFEIFESDSPGKVLAKFRAGMAGVLDPDRADLVGHLVGFDFSTSTAVQNLLGSASFRELAIAYLTNYIRAIAGEDPKGLGKPSGSGGAIGGPTIIFLEDVHWADDSSLDFLDHLATAVPNAQLLVVCLARPLLFERRPNWGEGRDAFTRLDLKPLSRRATRALVGEILQKAEDIPDDLRDLIVDGAEGNPFYVEELIKMLIEDGVILRGEERWRVELDHLADVRVPPTLTGVLQARLDSLPREERMLLQRASVVGRLFWDATVAELKADDADRLDRDKVTPLLNAVRGRELVFRRERSAFERTDEYIFKHALLRDVTYETVLLKLRRVYHAQVAQWLEANARERLGEYLSLIAMHYELAGEQEKAAEYLRRSGEALLEISAFHDALGAFERALAMLPQGDVGSRAALLARLGDAYSQVGDYPLAKRHFEEGLALARDAGDAQTEAAALIGLGRTAHLQGRYDEAKRHLEKGLALARECHDRGGTALALWNLGFVGWRQGEFEGAARHLEESVVIYRELGDRQGVANALSELGTVASMWKEPEKAKRFIEESLAIFNEIGDRRGIAVCLLLLGEIARFHEHKYEEARQYYEGSLAISREIDFRNKVATNLLNLGYVHTALGDADAAWGYYREALEESLAIGLVTVILHMLVGVAWLRAQAGQREQAARLLGLALSHQASNVDTEDDAEPVLAMLREALPADQLNAALERGKALDLDQVVAGILEEAAKRGGV